MVIALLFAIIQIFFCWCCFLSVLSKHHKITQSRVYRRINFRLLFQRVLAFNTWVVFCYKKASMIFFIPTKESQRKSCSVLKLICEADRRESFHNDDYHLRTLVVQVSWSTLRKNFPLARKPNTFIIVTSDKADQPGSHRLLLCNWNNKYLFGTYLYYLSHYANTFATVFHLST